VIKKLLVSILSKRGYTLIKKNHRRKKKASGPGYHRLEKLPSLATIIDVGVGDEGSPFLYERFRDAFYISIDPVSESREALDKLLQESQFTYIEKALGTEPGSIELEVSEKLSRTSMYKRTHYDSKSATSEKRKVDMETLDRVLSEFKITSPSLLKIDTEGSEMDILEAGQKTLEKVDYVVLELPLTKNFKNSYTFSDAILFMKKNGFEVFQILKAQNCTADLLFCKSGDTIIQKWAKG
jgi:FkbM family methyltransferase